MKKYILKKKAPILIITLCLSFSHSLLADNFYYFIDLNTAFNVNQDKQLTTLNISWSYDENISALMRQHNPDLKTLGTAIINDLGKNHYFINIQFNG